MLNLPQVGWRVHHVIITPALVMSVVSACVSSIVYVLGNTDIASALFGDDTALPTSALDTNATNATTELYERYDELCSLVVVD